MKLKIISLILQILIGIILVLIDIYLGIGFIIGGILWVSYYKLYCNKEESK